MKSKCGVFTKLFISTKNVSIYEEILVGSTKNVSIYEENLVESLKYHTFSTSSK